MQIYNETLRDLLIPDTIPLQDRIAVTIREDAKGRIIIPGLHQVNINSIEDLLNALNFGSAIRQTDATAINAKSSRSHAVFSINLVQKKNKSAEKSSREKRHSMPVDALMSGEATMTVDSKLHFVDLAGSERMKNTGASGERAKEGININAGLASLGKVISQLSSRQAGSHVSYRDSKLTRLLSDSLGGQAITYMVACVNPAEFHISETLNTIQYAQRARAIQSKPKIQQVNEDGDKQALIDRLRAEVNFLRDQLLNSERSERQKNDAQGRTEASHEKEIELQNHLLDVQENYNALSNRHARLISEISKARDGSGEELPTLTGAVGESAVERLQRSNSFSEAVEQVVLEYEKTIQSLESLLSNTRSTLSSTESKLLERETKCAYVDTVNQQLQSRIQKLIDREGSTEQYLHDLEAKLDGRSVGEERSSAAMVELRKEIARLRENESTSEEYISTLEERLAEADQDAELMTREISRLEHVVERQRSVGKLDNLLFELDNAQGKAPGTIDSTHDGASLTNGVDSAAVSERKRGLSEASYKVAVETPIPETDEEYEEGEHPPPMTPTAPKASPPPFPQTPAQTKFVEEKLENVNQELFGLRVEHESTVHDYGLLQAKYEEALRTLATLQQHVDDHRQPPQSPTAFLSDARVKELKNAGQPSSSRSLSSELSSAGESLTASEPSEVPTTPLTAVPKEYAEEAERETKQQPEHEASTDKALTAELESLKLLCEQKEQSLTALKAEHEDLNEQRLDALDKVEELKAEVQKAKMAAPPSSPTSGFLRRKSSQNVLTVDRAHRSLAALGNIASENFADNHELQESFALHMGSIMHELHQRSERVQVLESENTSVKKEMESKMSIISGLARERSSLKQTSPVDMSMFSSMRDQILQHEHQLQMLHASSSAREAELVKEIASLKDTLNAKTNGANATKETESPGEREVVDKEYSAKSAELTATVSKLQDELSGWEEKHQAVIGSMQASENRLVDTVSELQTTLANAEEMREAKEAELNAQVSSAAAAAAAFDLEREKHMKTVESLTVELDQHKYTIDGHAARIAELETANNLSQEELGKSKTFKEETHRHLENHREQISLLEQQLAQHQASVEFHKHGLKSLHDSHVSELDQVRRTATDQAEADAEARIAELESQHQQDMKGLHCKTKELEGHLEEHKTALEQHKQQVNEKGAMITRLEQEKSEHTRSASDASGELQQAQSRLRLVEEAKASAQAALDTARAQLEELNWAKSELNSELNQVREKEQRASRLVEELEGELATSFERSQQASSRLSMMQDSKDRELAEARAATIKAQEEIAVLNNRIEQLDSHRGSMVGGTTEVNGDRSNSLSSGARKTSSVNTLPSPPPAIPLPPLPAGSPPPTSPQRDSADKRAEEQENRIRTIEKHLFAEKQLTATLEEALVDLETQGKKVKAEVESWKKKAWDYEDELTALRKERNANRHSLQAVEEERSARREAEAARAHLEERMAALNKKKKKSTLNCF